MRSFILSQLQDLKINVGLSRDNRLAITKQFANFRTRSFYNKVNKDLTSANQNIVKDTIQELITKQELPVTAQNLIITTPRTSRICLKPKIHKPNHPGHPIELRTDDVTNFPTVTQTFSISVRAASENMPLTSTFVRSFMILTKDDGVPPSKFERNLENYMVEQLRRWFKYIDV